MVREERDAPQLDVGTTSATAPVCAQHRWRRRCR